MAAAFAYIFRGGDDQYIEKWREFLPATLSPHSVLPEIDKIDLDTLPARRNALLLKEIIHRSKNYLPLLEGLPHFVQESTEFLLDEMLHLNNYLQNKSEV